MSVITLAFTLKINPISQMPLSCLNTLEKKRKYRMKSLHSESQNISFCLQHTILLF
jgi:hypothetical protein